MSSPSLLLLAFGAAFAASLLLTPAVRGFARSAGLVAAPAADRWHRRPTALIGGAAIFAGFATGVFAVLGGAPGSVWAGPFIDVEVIGILAAASVMFAAGMLDDRLDLRPTTKLILQGIAAAIVVSVGVVYPITPWAPVNILFTIFWFIGLTNALNLLDNMDGVAAGVAGIAGIFLAFGFLWEGQWALAVICMALTGAVAGFLPYNYHPASIFMGDSGSLFLGALLAGLGAAYPSTASGSIVSVLFIPVCIAAIPILDTALVTLTRTVAGRPISVGGRDHTSHRLVALGLSEPQAALLLYAFAVLGGLTAIVVRWSGIGLGLLAAGFFLVALLIPAAYLAQFHTYARDGAAPPRGRVTVLVSNLLYKRRALEVLLDLVLFALAYYGAYLLRYDGLLPPSEVSQLEATLAVVVVSKSAAFGLLGVYRGRWRQLTVADAHRIGKATVLGSLIAVAAITLAFPGFVVPRTVWVGDALLTGLISIGVRASFRSFDRLRTKMRRSGVPVLVYGAGKAGEMVVRELTGNEDLNLQPIGFVDDDPHKHGALIHGLPVIGSLEKMGAVIERQGVRRVVISTKGLDRERLDAVVRVCTERGVEVMQFEMGLNSIPLGHPAAGGVA